MRMRGRNNFPYPSMMPPSTRTDLRCSCWVRSSAAEDEGKLIGGCGCLSAACQDWSRFWLHRTSSHSRKHAVGVEVEAVAVSSITRTYVRTSEAAIIFPVLIGSAEDWLTQNWYTTNMMTAYFEKWWWNFNKSFYSSLWVLHIVYADWLLSPATRLVMRWTPKIFNPHEQKSLTRFHGEI